MATPVKSGEISIPFSGGRHTPTGVHSCRSLQSRTFISRSFFSLCFDVNRPEKAGRMKRRDFLQISLGLSAQSIVGGSLLSIREAEADTGLPIAALQGSLDPAKDLVLVPGDKTPGNFDFNKSFNMRLQITPRVRVVAASAGAVSSSILWATGNGVSFAVRSGGHSYEGFSQSPDLVIDVRGIIGFKLSTDKKSVSI